jgi:hypothetical protein
LKQGPRQLRLDAERALAPRRLNELPLTALLSGSQSYEHRTRGCQAKTFAGRLLDQSTDPATIERLRAYIEQLEQQMLGQMSQGPA